MDLGFGFIHLMSEKKSKSQVFAARLFSTLLLWGSVTAVFMSDSVWAFSALMVLLGCAASWEYFSMAKSSDYPVRFRWGLILSFVYLVGVGYILATEGRGGLLSIVTLDGAVIAFAAISTFVLQLRRQLVPERALNAVATTVIGFVYIAFMFSFMLKLMFVPAEQAGGGVPGAWLIIWLVAVTKFTDMGAYITGSLIGKNKMIKHISPGKTWEGFYGALLWAQLAGCGLYALLGDQLSILSSWTHVIILGIILALLAVVGDLAESVIKRCFKSKDSGKTLPGIGGALDLIDSLCFTAPALFYYIYFFLLN